MKRANIEMAVGLFLVAGFLCFLYLTVRLGDIEYFKDETYHVTASFNSISGLKEGALVEIAGVEVRIEQDPARMRPSEVPVLYGSYERAKRELGWEPRYELRESLEDIYRYWYEETGGS